MIRPSTLTASWYSQPGKQIPVTNTVLKSKAIKVVVTVSPNTAGGN